MSKYKVNTYFFTKQIAEAEDPNRDCSKDFLVEDGKLIKYVGPGGDVAVPDGVRSIEDRAFANNWLLTSIRIPESVKQVGTGVFHGCMSLRGVHIPGHLLEGLSPLRAMSIFTDEYLNYPQKEDEFISEILSGTDDYSEDFRNLFINELMDPFHAVRWLRNSISQNRPDWVQRILDLHEDCPLLKIDGCIQDAAAQGKAEIVTRLLQYQQERNADPQWELSID